MWTDRTGGGGLAVRRRGLAIACVAAALGGCGGAQSTGERVMRTLPETRALEVILEAFQHENVGPQFHRTIAVAGDRTLEIDVATAGHDHGVEYVSAQDRVDLGDAIPRRQHADSLLTMVGAGPDARVDVLVLDEREFPYEPDPDLAGPGRPTLVEVEDRLRRAVIDYLAYLRRRDAL